MTMSSPSGKRVYERQPGGSLKLISGNTSYDEIQPQEKLIDREQYIEILKKWLCIEDEQAIDVILATALATDLLGDPLWMFLIGPAGGAKTEISRSLKGKQIYTISTITPQTLISGLKGSSNADLLPKLDGKLLVIKDFTSILSKKTEDQTAIFADLRESHDGYLEKGYGSGVGVKRYESTFGILACVTPVIDKFRIVHSLLGERFLKCRLRTNSKDAVCRAGDLVGQEKAMRTELSEATTGCLAYHRKRIGEPIKPDDETYTKIKALADVTAKLRSEVSRDRYHKVEYTPSLEIGTRLIKQLLKLGQALAILGDRRLIGKQEYLTLLRVASDSIPKQRMQLVDTLMMQDEPPTSKQAGDGASIATKTATEILEDLWMLKLIKRTGDSVFSWRLTDETTELLSVSGLATQTTP